MDKSCAVCVLKAVVLCVVKTILPAALVVVLELDDFVLEGAKQNHS